MAHPRFFNERSSSSGEDRVAQRVFEIPELLENVLLHHNNMADIISMRHVSRTIQANVKGSPKLQRSMFLLPQLHSALQLPSVLYNPAGFAVGIEQKNNLPRPAPPMYSLLMDIATLRILTTYKLNAKFRTTYPHKLPIIGEALQATLLCQPPIKEIGYQFKCCGGGGGTISAPAGVTVGHLYNKAKEILQRHALCPFAPTNYLDENGFVNLEVYFSGELKLLETDPLFQGDYSNVYRFMRTVQPSPVITAVNDRLLDYSLAKSEGKFAVVNVYKLS
jgi:hypothetical protein